jgi:hypothetical protein
MGTQESRQVSSVEDRLKHTILAMKMMNETLNETNKSVLNINNRIVDIVDSVESGELTKEEAFNKIAKLIDSPMFKEV